VLSFGKAKEGCSSSGKRKEGGGRVQLERESGGRVGVLSPTQPVALVKAVRFVNDFGMQSRTGFHVGMEYKEVVG
jgi:hypothetical protein